MPACSSSPIDLLAARIGSTSDGVIETEEPADLVAALATVPDPRSRRGIRHRLVTVLALAVCAVLAGARSYVAIAEWAHDLPLGVRIRLGLTIRRATPSESAIRRLLQKVDPKALDQVVSNWLITLAAGTGCPSAEPVRISATPPSPTCRRVIAVDGKSARGARQADGRAVHLLAAFEVQHGIVLGQSVVDGKSNELIGRCAAPGRAENFVVTGRVDTA